VDEIIPIDKVMSIDEVACRLDVTQRDPVAAHALGLRLKAHVRARAGACLTSSVGIAPNKFLAKLASNLQKPDGLTLLEPAGLEARLKTLDLRALPGIGGNMEARLHKGGIADMAALWAASPETLRRIWGGIGGVKFHALLHGADFTEPPTARRSMSPQHVLAPEERTQARALPVLRELAMKAAERLRREGFYCRRISLDVKWDRSGSQGGHWGAETAFNETWDTAFLLQRVERLAARMPQGRPLRVGIAVSGLVAVAAHQPDLFARPERQDLARALDRLNGKFGRNTVGYGACVPVATGKIAFQRVPDLAEF
jgi:DNA polymerase-4